MVYALNELMRTGMKKMRGAFPVGPTYGTEYLPQDPVAAMREGTALADSDVEVRDRITNAYPGSPNSAACVRLGGDFAFGTAAWQLAEAHGTHCPTYVYRYDYAPRTFHWSGLGATHATELFAVFDVYRTRFGSLLTAAADRRSARRVSNDVQNRWRAFSRDGARLEHDPDADRRRAWEGFTLAAN